MDGLYSDLDLSIKDWDDAYLRLDDETKIYLNGRGVFDGLRLGHSILGKTHRVPLKVNKQDDIPEFYSSQSRVNLSQGRKPQEYVLDLFRGQGIEMKESFATKVSESIVLLISDGYSVGTAFYVAPNLIATAKHVIDGEGVEGIRFNGESIDIQQVYNHPKLDLAFIQTSSKNENHLVLSRRSKQYRGEIAGVGFGPDGGIFERSNLPYLTVSRGKHNAYGDSALLNSGGDSGGPIINDHGSVVGIGYASVGDAHQIGITKVLNNPIPFTAYVDGSKALEFADRLGFLIDGLENEEPVLTLDPVLNLRELIGGFESNWIELSVSLEDAGNIDFLFSNLRQLYKDFEAGVFPSWNEATKRKKHIAVTGTFSFAAEAGLVQLGVNDEYEVWKEAMLKEF